MPTEELYGNYHFLLEVSGITTATISKFTSSSTYGNLPGEITLQRVAPLNRGGAKLLQRWYNESRDGTRVWKNISIVKYDYSGRAVQSASAHAWPCRWYSTESDATVGDAAVSVTGWDYVTKEAVAGDLDLNHSGLRTT